MLDGTTIHNQAGIPILSTFLLLDIAVGPGTIIRKTLALHVYLIFSLGFMSTQNSKHGHVSSSKVFTIFSYVELSEVLTFFIQLIQT